MTNLLDSYIANNANKPVSCFQSTQPRKTDKKKINAASIAGSAAGIVTATALIYAGAKKGNPGLKLKNLSYSEKDVFMIGSASVAGGLAGGLLVDKDKENRNYKLREAGQQIVGCTAIPVGILTVANRILKKRGIDNIPAKIVVTAGSLIGGMHIGNRIMNSVNDMIFKDKVKHEVKPEDYLVHTDDICVTASMVLKDFPSAAAVTSRLLPASFIVQGAKTGMQTKNDK